MSLLAICLVSAALFPGIAIANLPAKKAGTYTAPDRFIEKGNFEVFVLKGKTWVKAGVAAFDDFYREKTVGLGTLPANEKETRVRLVQRGGGAAHIDAALLDGNAPVAIQGTSDKNALRKISSREFDVIDAYGKTVELVFPGRAENGKLTLFARVEGVVNYGKPFRFPMTGSLKKGTGNDFYAYPVDSRRVGPGQSGRSMENRSPFLKEFCISGTGHPSDDLLGWVGNDDRNLFIRIDFIGDNTRDGDKDYTKIYVRTAGGVRQFKVSEAEKKWGRPGFTYTGKAPYQHKVYDFRIPFEAMGLPGKPGPGTPLQLAFEAYGTLSGSLLVISTSPDNSAVNVPVDNTISATFNQAVAQSSVDNTSFKVVRTSDSSPVGGTFSFSPDNSVVTFTPLASLDPLTNYTVTLPGDAISSQIGGFILPDDYVWSFTTAGTDNTVTLFFKDTPGIFGCAVAGSKGSWEDGVAAFGLILLPALVLAVRKRIRGAGRQTGGKLLVMVLVASLVLLAGKNVAAGPLGPPQPAAKPGHLSLGAGYFYSEDKWEPDVSSVQASGITVNWATDRVKQNSLFLRGEYGISKGCGVTVRAGVADRAAPQSFEDSYAFFGGVGAKGILYSNASFAIGPVVEFNLYGKNDSDIVFTQGGTTWRGRATIENSMDITAGIGLQANLGKALVYGGPLFAWTKADVAYVITNGPVNLNVSNGYNQKNLFGGFAGIRLPLIDRVQLEVEGQYRSEFSAGASLLYAF
jgi:hypothetical protein